MIMSNKPVLCIQVNEETQLRLLEERHVEEYFALIERNHEHLHEWVAVEAYEGSVETLRAYMKQRLLQFVNGEAYRLNWRRRNVELGYWIDATMEGKGIVTQACRTMVRHAFEEHEVHKVEVSCATDNTRSRAVAERLGFTQEGILRQTDRLHGRYVDGVFYGLLVDEWNARAKHAQGLQKEPH